MVKQACIESVYHGVIEQSVSGFDGFVNLLCGVLVNSFRARLKKAYFENMVECPVSLTLVSRACATSVFWRSGSEGEAESGPSSSKERAGRKTPGHPGGGKSRGRR